MFYCVWYIYRIQGGHKFFSWLQKNITKQTMNVILYNFYCGKVMFSRFLFHQTILLGYPRLCVPWWQISWKMIVRYGPTLWPHRSFDITPLDFFFFGGGEVCIKYRVFWTPVKDIERLIVRITDAVSSVAPQMLGQYVANGIPIALTFFELPRMFT